jgi:hypothetical protein
MMSEETRRRRLRTEEMQTAQLPPMMKTVLGKIHGETIELYEELDVVDGQEVEVQITVTAPAGNWGEGILRTAGAQADDP